jgi:hypothetical protein
MAVRTVLRRFFQEVWVKQRGDDSTREARGGGRKKKEDKARLPTGRPPRATRLHPARRRGLQRDDRRHEELPKQSPGPYVGGRGRRRAPLLRRRPPERHEFVVLLCLMYLLFSSSAVALKNTTDSATGETIFITQR